MFLYNAVMPKLNKNLMRSIVQDLGALDKICSQLCEWVEDDDCMSWRYPTLRCDNVHVNSILHYNTGSAGESYVLTLELIYDRFHYLIYLVTKYLDVTPITSEQFSLPRNIIPPGHLSVGALLSMFWTRIEAVHQCTVKKMVEGEYCSSDNDKECMLKSLGAVTSQCISSPAKCDKNSYLRSTQTEKCLLTHCESCLMTQKVIRNLVQHIELACKGFKVESTVTVERVRIREDLNHLSQWGAVKNWTGAAQQDIEKLVQLFAEERERNQQLQANLNIKENELEEKLQKKDCGMRELEEEVLSLKQQLKAEKFRSAQLMKEKEEVEDERRLISANFEALQVEYSKSETRAVELETTKTIFESELKKLACECKLRVVGIEDYGKILDTWREQISVHEETKRELERELELLEKKLEEKHLQYFNQLARKDRELEESQCILKTELSSLKDMNDMIKEQNKQLETQSKEREENERSLKEEIGKLRRELKESKLRERMLLKAPDKTPQVKTRVCGNPETDLAREIQANRLRIKFLTEETKNLEATLNKLISFPKLPDKPMVN